MDCERVTIGQKWSPIVVKTEHDRMNTGKVRTKGWNSEAWHKKGRESLTHDDRPVRKL